jgi:hypothetical protein
MIVKISILRIACRISNIDEYDGDAVEAVVTSNFEAFTSNLSPYWLSMQHSNHSPFASRRNGRYTNIFSEARTGRGGRNELVGLEAVQAAPLNLIKK